MEHEQAAPGSLATVPTLRLRLLGGFQLSVGDRPITDATLRLRKGRALLKILALAPAHTLLREQLLNLLWPDLDPNAAANNLHYTLHATRRALGPLPPVGFLRLHDARLTLGPPGAIWVDVAAFEQAAATADRARDIASYQAALALYGGDLIPEDRYEDWASAHRERLRQLRQRLLLDLAQVAEFAGATAVALQALERVVTDEPTSEAGHGGLMRLYALGGQRQQALRQYQLLREVLRSELDAEPDATSQHLYATILAGQLPTPSATEPQGAASRPAAEARDASPSAPLAETRPHNLPLALTSFVGRQEELAAIADFLAHTRLLTLIGPGGAGKSRLALAAATMRRDRYADGVWLVELAALSDPLLVPGAIAQILGAREEPYRPLIVTLVAALQAKELLLVLDNCEHLIDACAALVQALLEQCPGLRVLATSREALRVPGEATRQVPPLSMPEPNTATAPGGTQPDLRQLLAGDAAQLFIARASVAQPAFAPTAANAAIIAAICRRLDGLPLAIELAATRVAVLTVEQIAARLDNALGVLTSGGRTALPRHRTLRATLDWSYALLGEEEQALYRRLAVFVGGFGLEAAEAVGAGATAVQEDVLALLAQLVDKSLVQVETALGEARYRLLETVRQHAAAQLAARGEAAATRQAHAAHFLALAERAAPQLRGPTQTHWLARLDRDHDNLRASLHWAQEGHESALLIRLGDALSGFWWARSHLSEGRRWAEAALAQSDAQPARLRTQALILMGLFLFLTGDHAAMVALDEENLPLVRASGDPVRLSLMLARLGLAISYTDQTARAYALADEAISTSRQLGDSWILAFALLAGGIVARHQRDLARAAPLLGESLTLSRAIGDDQGVAAALANLGYVALLSAENAQARAALGESLLSSQRMGDTWNCANCLEGLAAVAALSGDTILAVRLYGAIATLRERIGAPTPLPDLPIHEQQLAAARDRLDATTFATAWADWQGHSLDALIRAAMAQRVDDTTDVHQPTALSRREQEVATLLARGQTNRQIAITLSIAERTVDTHVGHILHKLGVATRAQAAVLIAQQDGRA